MTLLREFNSSIQRLEIKSHKSMSFKRNVIASYATQGYVTLVGILVLPLYLSYMGAEAYGLVGFFTMLQFWFNLLDLGLTPTIARESARYKGGAVSAINYLRLFRALQVIFFLVALLGGSAIFINSGFISEGWLKFDSMSLDQVQMSIELMAAGVALRWMSGLYRGCISGSEELVWLGFFNAFIATLRFIGVLPVLVWVSHEPRVFFIYQLLVSLLELVGLLVKAFSLFPSVPKGQSLGWSIATFVAPIKPVLKFSLTIAFTSSVSVLVTQTDKLVLSKLLPLADYGYFTLAVLAASGVMVISGPISGALLPRLARLQAEGDDAGLILLYRNVTQMVAVIAVPASLILAVFAEQVLWIWTGDYHATAQAAPIMRLYALGNGFLALAAFPYYLQYAKGDLKLHLIGNAGFLIALIPPLIWFTIQNGVVGAGYVWLCANIAYFFFWVPKVHNRFTVDFHFQWLKNDVGAIALPTVISVLVIKLILEWPKERFSVAMYILMVGFVLIIIATTGSSYLRELMQKKLKIATNIIED